MKKLYKFLLYLFIGVILSTSFTLFYLYFPNALKPIDNLLRDNMFVARGAIPDGENVVIIDIDEASLSKIGRWPWSRDIVAKLIQNLADGGAGIIALDIMFPEPDNTSPHFVLNKIGMKTDNVVNYDAILAQTIANTPTILAHQFFTNKDKYHKKEFPMLSGMVQTQECNLWDDTQQSFIPKVYGTLLNIPVLQNNSYSSGFVNFATSTSGVVREIPLIMENEGAIHLSLSLEIIKIIADDDVQVRCSEIGGVEEVVIGDYIIPTSVSGLAFINFRGGEKTFKYISAKDILTGTYNKEDIDGKIILIGTSAAGLRDLKAIAFDSAFPGVEVHANLIDNILSGDYISTQYSDAFNVFHIIAITFITILSMAYVPSFVIAVLLFSYLFLDLYFLYTMLFSEGMILNIFIPLFALVVSSVSVVLINNLVISRNEKHIKEKVTQIEKAKKQIEGILSSILMPILIISKKTKTILYANEYASKQYGMDTQDLKGIAIDDVYKNEEQEIEIEEILKEKGFVENKEQIFKTTSQKEFTALLSVVPLSFGNEEANISMVTDITKQKKIEQEIRRLHTNTKESIKYASLIQGALLPDDAILEKFTYDYFALWRPRDIVGGDIYLVEELSEDELLIMVIDGAGHGVPGAFVTMLVKAISTQIIADIKNGTIPAHPNVILQLFNQGIKTMLKQEKGSRSNTGFDGGILYYNKKENKCLYSGAKTDLYVIVDDKLDIIKGDRKNVGFIRTKFDQEYTNHTIRIEQITKLYLATDGIVDQEGENDTRFDDEFFENIILNNNLKDFNTQKDIINDVFNDFKQDLEQSDDVTVVGIALKVTKEE
ncbi:CHASE2 domain-containing protein [Sulfurimonas sp. SAG-AH-194-I05]|nr:CHASE2 domain-containing protein [Sulfurimonas sp. SAG-AH-194-I05]MDF1875066.1 CHASE2 domain-containing protein [Sulfurimonas sp. SAG-AH-194-I05]